MSLVTTLGLLRCEQLFVAKVLVTLIIQFFCDLMNWFAVAFLG